MTFFTNKSQRTIEVVRKQSTSHIVYYCAENHFVREFAQFLETVYYD